MPVGDKLASGIGLALFHPLVAIGTICLGYVLGMRKDKLSLVVGFSSPSRATI